MNEELIFQELKKYRDKLGLKSIWSWELTCIAQSRANQEANECDELDHKEFFGTLKFPFYKQGEILGRGFDNAKDLIKAWDKSQTHHDVMVDDYTCLGIGVYNDHYCIIFGKSYWDLFLNILKKIWSKL